MSPARLTMALPVPFASAQCWSTSLDWMSYLHYWIARMKSRRSMPSHSGDEWVNSLLAPEAFMPRM